MLMDDQLSDRAEGDARDGIRKAATANGGSDETHFFLSNRAPAGRGARFNQEKDCDGVEQ